MKKILLIDDDSAIRHVLVRILVDENFGAFAAADGEEALACAARMKFDLILLNLKLPENEGWASFQELSGLYPQVPIILMTAESNQLFPPWQRAPGLCWKSRSTLTVCFPPSVR